MFAITSVLWSDDKRCLCLNQGTTETMCRFLCISETFFFLNLKPDETVVVIDLGVF